MGYEENKKHQQQKKKKAVSPQEIKVKEQPENKETDKRCEKEEERMFVYLYFFVYCIFYVLVCYHHDNKDGSNDIICIIMRLLARHQHFVL